MTHVGTHRVWAQIELVGTAGRARANGVGGWSDNCSVDHEQR